MVKLIVPRPTVKYTHLFAIIFELYAITSAAFTPNANSFCYEIRNQRMQHTVKHWMQIVTRVM